MFIVEAHLPELLFKNCLLLLAHPRTRDSGTGSGPEEDLLRKKLPASLPLLPLSQAISQTGKPIAGAHSVSAITMKVVAAYLLAVLGGKSSPTDKDIKKILSSGRVTRPLDI